MNKFFRHTDFEKRRMPSKSGLTIVELLVVIGIIAAVVAISIPAINAMQKSFDSTGAESMINAALATARTLAISRQQYVGVRFQTSYKSNDVLDEEQYMIFIIFDNTNDYKWVCGFVAVEGYKPIKLPKNIGVMDKMVRKAPSAKICGGTDERPLGSADLGDNYKIMDTFAFSIVFSPAGKLVIHEMRCARKNSKDNIFNTEINVETNPPTGMFIEDDYDVHGIGVEMSRKELVIYNREEFKKLTTALQRWDYLNDNAKSVYINPYTGGIIEK